MDDLQVRRISDWLLEQGLLGLDEAGLVRGFCERCCGQGLDLVQAAIFLDTLHPVLESRGFLWNAEETDAIRHREFSRHQSEDNSRLWQVSPFKYMLENALSEMHIPLDYTGEPRFTILDDLRLEGHTDYFAQIHRLSGKDAIGEMDSLYSRWSTKAPGGFSSDDLRALRSLVPALALAIKAASLKWVAQSLVEVYLGRDAGHRVLEGRIARGKVGSIHTVLWYSDMANYTALSEQVHSSDLIPLLNDYAEAVISSVHAAGGDVLKLVGDGTLAIFTGADRSEAALAALKAEAELEERIATLNAARLAQETAITSVYLALHVGEVFYGNVGSDERLDFTVIGPAVNEVCRIASTCRLANRSLLVSSAFVELLPPAERSAFETIGSFHLKGVREPRELFARS
ncbi:adenylate cyclase [Sinorhizobium terangae]|uniref:Adenylate/guanylate cyclase domain-containing protein n=1 Tax=Sinorhizobium terangae TaxID=110322 RepID=A0A6N7LAZ3_SINTE|nr:adenylate/guanylate cyclase domain-containing protein [Sinorhizobium terangae]MBB4188086.1 adenylate cyclase [Sinorhizobium terangae]MQX14460.1 adenylate/guanylate cyclase domain-containing protein [Sinorhizobium terangae]